MEQIGRKVFFSLQVKFVANKENEYGITDMTAHEDTNRECTDHNRGSHCSLYSRSVTGWDIGSTPGKTLIVGSMLAFETSSKVLPECTLHQGVVGSEGNPVFRSNHMLLAAFYHFWSLSNSWKWCSNGEGACFGEEFCLSVFSVDFGTLCANVTCSIEPRFLLRKWSKLMQSNVRYSWPIFRP